MILRIERYHDALRDIPPTGSGCHPALLSIANLGRLAGISPEQIEQDLAAHVHGNTREVTARERSDAVRKAFHSPLASYQAQATRLPVDRAKLLESILKRGAGFTEEDLWDASPIRIDWPPENDNIEFLRRMYAPNDRVFIGARHDATTKNIRPVQEWIDRFERGVAVPEFVIVNPLSGVAGKTKDGKRSFRSDDCVVKFRYTMIEFDTKPLDWQIEFWAGVRLPVVALIFSGSKSIHAWLRIDAESRNEWNARVESALFDLLRPLGIDGTSKNESRLSRMPGHFRTERNNWQKLLYLNPAGGAIQ